MHSYLLLGLLILSFVLFFSFNKKAMYFGIAILADLGFIGTLMSDMWFLAIFSFFPALIITYMAFHNLNSKDE